MPTAPIAATGSNGTTETDGGNSTTKGYLRAQGAEKYIVQNWSTTFKTIAMGGNDIGFVTDPLGDGTSGLVMQVNYPKGSYTPSLGPVMGGTQFYAAPFGDKTPFAKMMVSYEVAFPTGFNWVLGGKLPGVYGGSPYDGCSGGVQSTGANCLTMRLMWRPNGLGEVYAYVPADHNSNLCKSENVLCNDQYGKSIGRGLIYFAPNMWHRIDMVMALNDPAGKQNGLLEVYQNGVQVISMNNMPYRTTGMVGFQGLMFSSFFGGSDPSYATPVDTTVYFRNVQLSVGEPATLYEGPGSGSTRVKKTGGEMVTILWSIVAVVMALLMA
ncbi:hypothetical protein B0O80DRAFT_387622 [Mortierella sp. GBAus27b]|nr:hypothetical protein B0O80DRAFT_387622 [Mortierella sp. GBAus27b]